MPPGSITSRNYCSIELEYAEIYMSHLWMAFAQGWGRILYDTVNKKINLLSDPKVYEGLNEMYTLMEKGYMKQVGADATKYPNFVDGVNSVFQDIVYPLLSPLLMKVSGKLHMLIRIMMYL